MNIADIKDKVVKEGCVQPSESRGMVDKLDKTDLMLYITFDVKTNIADGVDPARQVNIGIGSSGSDSKPVDIGQMTEDSIKKRLSHPAKRRDNRKKTKPHEKTIKKLQQEGWIKVKRGRNQVTLVKLPEREPSKVSNTESLSKSAGTKTDLSNSSKSLRGFLRKFLKGMFVCGRKED